MVASTFKWDVVMAVLYSDDPSNLTPSLEELQAMDTGLRDRYNAALTGALAAHGLPNDDDTRAQAVLLAKLGASGTASLELSRACQFLKNVRDTIG